MKINDWYIGIVEDINDPTGQGRVRVRCLGYHTPDRNELPTQDLPLATQILPVTSASSSGIGISATGIIEGSWVFGFFRDGNELQDPVILGTIASASAGSYDLGYDSTINMGFGDAHKTFSNFIGNDIPSAAGTYTSLNSESVNAAKMPFASGMIANSSPGLTSFDTPLDTTQINGNSDKLISIARSQLGVIETSTNQGPGIEKYWSATNYPSGYSNRAPWCAAFVSWCVQQSGILPSTELPKTASAFGFNDWAAGKSYAQLRYHPRYVKRGDIVTFAFSHVGIATSDSDTSGTFTSIDGNTGNRVNEKPRRLSQLKSAITLVS